MKADYQSWIDAFAAKRKGYLRGYCMTATAEMVAAFPELIRVAGFCNGAEHFWCVTPEGEVVDPTAKQFGDGPYEYKPFESGDEVRVGRCMDCGDDIYANVDALGGARKYFCNDDCRRSFGAYLDAEEEARDNARRLEAAIENENPAYAWDDYDPYYDPYGYDEYDPYDYEE